MSHVHNDPNRAEKSKDLPIDLSAASLPKPSEAFQFEGVTETSPAPGVKVLDVDFEEAAAHVNGKPNFKTPWSDDVAFVVWQDDRLRLCLDRFSQDKVADNPDLPPYSCSLMVQPGTNVYIHYVGSGWSSMDDKSGRIIRAGKTEIHFYEEYVSDKSEKPFMKLTVNLDKCNDWGYPERPAVTAESRELKKSWNRFWHPPSDESCTGFQLDATKRKPLDFKTADEMRELEGPAELIRIWERDHDAKLEELFDYAECYRFAYDPKSKSYAMAEYTYGESDHRLYIFKQDGSFVGYYRVQDDGSREWLEAYPGELGKPE